MKFDVVQLGSTGVGVIDGDRGKNYPHQNELFNTGFCLFLSAKNVTKSGFNFSETQFISPEKDALLNNGKLKRGDIVITTRGTVGNVALYSQQVSYDNIRINSGMLIIRCPHNISNQYLYQVLRSEWFQKQIMTVQSGSAQPQLPKSHFLKMNIPLPPLPIQKKIASILQLIEDKITINNAINDNLQQQTQALFKNWFIDNPDAISWKEGTFSNLIEKTISGDWGKESPSGNNTEMVYCIRGTDIPEVRAGNKGKMPTRYILPKNYAAKQLVDGDIDVEISGGSPTQSTGRAAAVSNALLARYDKGMVCTNFCKALKPRAGYSMYVYYYWQYLYDKNIFFSYENGTTGIKNLDINGFIETEPIIIAPAGLVEKFDAFCQTFFSKIYANGMENEQLALIRDALLPKLMSGELDVSAVEL